MGWTAGKVQDPDLGGKRQEAHTVPLASVWPLVLRPTARLPGACAGWAETHGSSLGGAVPARHHGAGLWWL